MPDPKGSPAVAPFEQRVACPSCGRLMLKVTDRESSFTIETKCKTGGCHKISRVTYKDGKFNVTLL